MGEIIEDDHWIAFIERNYNIPLGGMLAYDVLIDKCIENYKLKKKSNKQDLVSKRVFLCRWHAKMLKKSNWLFAKYTTQSLLAKELGIDHTTISHYINHRKDPLNYKEQVECIKDFLNS